MADALVQRVQTVIASAAELATEQEAVSRKHTHGWRNTSVRNQHRSKPKGRLTMYCDHGHEAENLRKAPLPNGATGLFCPEHYRRGNWYSQITYALRKASEQRRIA